MSSKVTSMLEAPQYGGEVTVTTDFDDNTVSLKCNGDWFTAQDLRFIAKSLKKMAKALEAREDA
jgi:hypothetical protein